jgi:hypothetical protein
MVRHILFMPDTTAQPPQLPDLTLEDLQNAGVNAALTKTRLRSTPPWMAC